MVGCPPIPLSWPSRCRTSTTPIAATDIPKMSFKVQNWPAYAKLGCVGVAACFCGCEDGVVGPLADLPDPDGQACYTDAAIQTSLMLRAAFKLPLRQNRRLVGLSAHADGSDDISARPHHGQPSRGDVCR